MVKALILLLSPLFLLPTPQTEHKEYTHLHIVDIENPLPLSKIKERYQAYDIIDGTITDEIIFETDYNENSCQIGSYDLKVSITNSSFYTTTIKDTILVRDFNPPIITVKNPNIELDISKPLDETILYNALEIKDNYDSSFELILDGIDEIYKMPGEYPLFISVIDSSTNQSNTVKLIVTSYETTEKTILSYTAIIQNQTITKEELIELFLKENPVSGYNKVELTTDIFNTTFKEGIYPAEIKFFFPDSTCKIFQFKLEVQTPTTDNSSWIKPVIIGTTTIFLLTIGIIIYRKRR